MDHITVEFADARNVWGVTGIVFVIAGTVEYKAGTELVLFTGCFVNGSNDPVIFLTVPGFRKDFQTEVNMTFYAIFARCVFNVIANRRAVGKHLGVSPRPKVVT